MLVILKLMFLWGSTRGEDVLFDESCRRCNGKEERRKRGGRRVQLPDWFMVLHSWFALISRLFDTRKNSERYPFETIGS